ncbi:MAG: hypothetical protein M3Q27_17770 [Actinomycetota bacterium]|nr:hypothetical protein [Actinomycetota bacterium]
MHLKVVRTQPPDEQLELGQLLHDRVTTTDTNTVPVADDIPAQLRRRHDATLRLPPLDDGRRDPLLARRPRMSVALARAAYSHLEACGLLSELVVDVLRREVE